MAWFRGVPTFLLLFLLAPRAGAQLSTQSAQVFASVSSSADSVRVPIDAPAQPGDVGAGAFTIEQWIRCARGDNPPIDTSYGAPDSEASNVTWIYGRIFLDRDINGSPPAGGGDWGASVHRASSFNGASVVRFGAENAMGTQLTIQGSADVCDDAWHHVAVGRNAADRLFIVVDGVADYTSAATIGGSLAYPDGAGGGEDRFLVWGNEKHGFWGGLVGYLDELRAWSVARTAQQVGDDRFTVLAGNTAGLELYLRLEEGSGQTVSDATGKNTGAVFLPGAWATSVPGPGATSTTTTLQPGATTSTTTAASSTTSTTVPKACTVAAECDDLDPCTADECVAGLCSQGAPQGFPGATCELRRFVDVPLCPTAPPRPKVARSIGRRLGAAARLLDAAAVAPERRSRRKTKAARRKLDAAETGIRTATERGRLDAACADTILVAIGRARAALPAE